MYCCITLDTQLTTRKQSMKYIVILLLFFAGMAFAEDGKLTPKQEQILHKWTVRQELIKSILDDRLKEIKEAEASKDKCLHKRDTSIFSVATHTKTSLAELKARYERRKAEYTKELKGYAREFDEAAKE